MHPVLRPGPAIRHADLSGLVVILDFATEDYFVLDDETTRAWMLLEACGGYTAEAARQAAATMAMAPADAAAWLADALADCVRRGFLVPPGAAEPANPPPDAAPRLPATRLLAGRAFAALAATAIGLRVKGFAHVYGICARARTLPDAGDHADRLRRAERAFLLAENFVWLPRAPDDCLPRSLALYRFLRALGLPAAHRIGGRRFPVFTMHAWVECLGRVVLDEQRCATEYRALTSLPP